MKIVIGITGASGSIYAEMLIKKIERLKSQVDVCHIVFSDCGKEVWDYELGKNKRDNLPFKIFAKDDFFAPFASGTSAYDVMIICPCTMGTLGRIAHGISNDLITRAADVFLKERKKLILVTREMPLNLIHINNMKSVTEAGGIICPASPSFYNSEAKTNDILETVVNKILNLAGFKIESFRWGNKNQ
ncbi:MAG: UbiX family flavin prenyltransferase [Bacteroidales bacterium]|nr:UbiX family flavin prenyltransferase [Bacteroidales bacterium]